NEDCLIATEARPAGGDADVLDGGHFDRPRVAGFGFDGAGSSAASRWSPIIPSAQSGTASPLRSATG
ncbi:hypothetical protein, partial [Clostridioides difficile]|uniref:hypothetical protein n=1 Tax=Clostridioides difficile TaxID=1496 RepID=UPI0031B58C1F